MNGRTKRIILIIVAAQIVLIGGLLALPRTVQAIPVAVWMAWVIC